MKKLRLAALLLSATAALVTTPALACSGCHQPAPDNSAKVGPHTQLLQAATFPATVVAEFRTYEANGADKVAIAAQQMATAVTALGIEVVSVLPRVPLITVRVSTVQKMLSLLAHPEVLTVRPDNDVLLDALDVEASDLARIPELWAANSYRGVGISVAVIDTGIATYKVGSAGKTSTLTSAGSRVIARVDWTGIAPWYGTNYVTGMMHGSYVADIIHAIVPDAKLLDLRVGDTNQAPTVSNIAKAVNWIIDNRELYNIRVANISMSAGTKYTSNCSTGLSNLIRDLAEFGVTTVVSSGNDGYVDGVPEPACSAYALTVGATWDYTWTGPGSGYVFQSGSAWGQGNFGPQVDVLAPGCKIAVTDFVTPASQGLNVCGTSVASPFVSGVVASILGANGVNASPATMRSVIAYGSNTYVPAGGRNYPALDALTALNLARDYLPPHNPELQPLPFPTLTGSQKGSTNLCSTTVCNWAPQ